ncbi:MAG: hypothetical protein J6B81_00655 [Spirochaetaceae bacterium]|nr:hypothetical protein [Spirochaetaceae bacterium]
MNFNPKPKNYDDILYTKWPLTSFQKEMPLEQRAKIFLPFAALKGHNEALAERLCMVEKEFKATK